jgi:hypothetical protein
MEPMHTTVFVSARRAATLVRDLFDVVREVNEWRHERDAFVAMYLDEVRRRDGDDRGEKTSRPVGRA